jgi:diguanylate cyclase (GGDEF)-like protein
VIPSSEDRAGMIARLTGLLEVTLLARSAEDLDALLPAIGAAVAESLGFATVVISIYRPAWDDFRVEAVHGSEDGRQMLLGRERTWVQWSPLLDPDFEHHGCYLLPWDTFDWSRDTTVSYVPDLPASDDPDAWHPEDALFVPLRRSDGRVLGIMSVDEPLNGRRPADEDLRVLAALADHAAQAVEDAQSAAEAAHHRKALEHMLRVSADLNDEVSVDRLLVSVCEGIRGALGFQSVSVELVDAEAGRAVPRAVVGWTMQEIEASQSGDLAVLDRLLDPAFEIEGCFLLPNEEACARLGIDRPGYETARNGTGPHAWNHHWLLIPLRGADGQLTGVIWADEPEDRLLPSRESLQALRLFANQASTAVASAAAFAEMRFLADHDPLTRLGNRRAFTARLVEVAHRGARYDRPFGLVVLDVDGFKALNDAQGHLAGDIALEAIGEVLRHTLRRSDTAFRLGGDEFALILSEAGEHEATMVVDRVGAGIAAIDAGEGHTLRASFGIALGATAADPERLLRAADAAMYEAKRAGAGVRFAVPEPPPTPIS